MIISALWTELSIALDESLIANLIIETIGE